jgi:hypothetical protein
MLLEGTANLSEDLNTFMSQGYKITTRGQSYLMSSELKRARALVQLEVDAVVDAMEEKGKKQH